ncbi:MAG: hypothetical protein GXX79_03945 [Actinomycetales bacterium]|nr:hypothetical protein [Actinomycetales bacterium]
MSWGPLTWPVRTAFERDGVCATHSVYPSGRGGCLRCSAASVGVHATSRAHSAEPADSEGIATGDREPGWWDRQAAAWERIAAATDPDHRTRAADIAAEARATAALYRAADGDPATAEHRDDDSDSRVADVAGLDQADDLEDGDAVRQAQQIAAAMDLDLDDAWAWL